MEQRILAIQYGQSADGVYFLYARDAEHRRRCRLARLRHKVLVVGGAESLAALSTDPTLAVGRQNSASVMNKCNPEGEPTIGTHRSECGRLREVARSTIRGNEAHDISASKDDAPSSHREASTLAVPPAKSAHAASAMLPPLLVMPPPPQQRAPSSTVTELPQQHPVHVAQ